MRPAPKILVTGASGFIGRRLTAGLKQSGHDVRLLTRPMSAIDARDVEVVYAADFAEITALRAAVRGVNVVVHLASVVHRSHATAAELTEVNVNGTRHVAEEAAGAGAAHLIFVSSIAAVGRVNGRVNEAAVPNPVTPYGVSKLQAERESFRVAAGSGMAVTVLRPPMVYGPGMKGNPMRLFRALALHVPLPLRGADHPRSTLFVDNLVAAILLLAATTPERSAVYHVSDREVLSVEDFARASAEALGVYPLLVRFPSGLANAAMRLGEIFPLLERLGFSRALSGVLGERLVIDSSRFAAETGFTPPSSVSEGLDITARWFRSR